MSDLRVRLSVESSLFGVLDPDNPENNREHVVESARLTVPTQDVSAFVEALSLRVEAEDLGYFLGSAAGTDDDQFLLILGTEQGPKVPPAEALPVFVKITREVGASGGIASA